MSPLRLSFGRHEFIHPALAEPSWSGRVERWYQLDAAAYGLCELYTKLELDQVEPPKVLFLASPGGSRAIDLQFVRHGASNPAKFVHTLPNVRGSVLLQVMRWHGPLMCIQNDPHTVESALAQAALWTRHWNDCAWVVGVRGNSAFCFRFGPDGDFVIEPGPGDEGSVLDWLETGEETLTLPMQLRIRRA